MAYWNSYCHYNRCNLKPSEIFFSQDSIASRFRDGRSVQEAADRVLHRQLNVEDFPTIEVVKRSDGKYYSLDNRRLYVFRVGQYNGIVAKVPVTIVPEQWYHQRKFTSRNGGTEIRVRRGSTYDNWKSSWNKPEVHNTVAAVRQQSTARSQLFGINQIMEENSQAVRTRRLQVAADNSAPCRRVGYVATAARYTSPQKKKEPDISSAFGTLTLTPTKKEVLSPYKFNPFRRSAPGMTDVNPTARRQNYTICDRPLTANVRSIARSSMEKQRQVELRRLRQYLYEHLYGDLKI